MSSSSTERRQWKQRINAKAVETAHLVKLAQQPGWWDYVKAKARELEKHESRLYLHIERDVAQRLQQLGWRPPK